MEIKYAPRIGEVSSISKESVIFSDTGHFPLPVILNLVTYTRHPQDNSFFCERAV